MDLVYLVGPPGAGKSTLMAALTGDEATEMPGPPPHRLIAPDAAEVGRRRDRFSGTDALSMSIHPVAVEWITGRPYRLVLGEGARLATRGFLYAAHAAGYGVTVGYLVAPAGVLAARCAQRGSTQSAAWQKGAATRAQRVADAVAMDMTVIALDARLPAAELAAILRKAVPALEGL